MQLFQNIISNSIKYSGNNCVISIRVKKANDEWIFSIQDNGPGIEPEYHEQIFTLQKRLHTKERSGSGIGLAICKKAIENHNGRIWVESELNKGATFYFTVPIYENHTDDLIIKEKSREEEYAV